MAAAWSELGPANSDEVNAPGGGVTGIVSLVRAQVHQAILALEVHSRQVEDWGLQQGWPTPAAVYQRRSSLSMRLRAAFLALWRRASGTLAATGLSSLRDDDGAPVIRGLPGMYALSLSPERAQLLGELASALASALTRDQAYLGGLSRAPPASPLGAARLLACKRDCRALAEIALPPLTEHAGDSTAERARLQARYVLSLGLKRLESSIDERLARGASAVLRDLVNLEPPRLAAARGKGAPPMDTAQAGTGEALAPPD